MTDKSRSEPAEEFSEVDVRQPLGADAPAPGEDLRRDPSEAPATDVQELRQQRDEYYDLLLRKAAEFDNYRKRIERERREQAENAAADVLAALLPIVDDLERALQGEAGSEAAEAYRRGIELIHQQLLDLLRKRGVAPIEAVGTMFDPRFHQAIVHEAEPSRRDGEVIEEFRRGYMLGDRLLRPAMVKVAKA